MEQSTVDANDSRFPIEIWDKIFRTLRRPNLASVSKVNRVFYAISVPILYRSIRPRRARSCVSCLKSLCQNDFLASLVRALHINLERYSPTSSLYRIVNQALRRLHRLETLSLEVPSQHIMSSVSIGYIFEGCRFRLTTLRVSLPYDSSFANFLASQPGIVHLIIFGEVAGLRPDFGLLPYAIPRLAYLCAPLTPASFLANFIRDRRVRHIGLDYPGDAATFDALLLSKVPITRLMVRWWPLNLLYFRQMVKCAKQVRALILHVVFTCSTLIEIHEYLSELTALKTLEIYGKYLVFAEGGEKEFALNCFQHCPSLTTVQFLESAWCKRTNGDSIDRLDGNIFPPRLWSEALCW